MAIQSTTVSRPTCQLVRAETTFTGKQGLDYFHGISAESVGAHAICLHLLTIPPGARANAHLHENHETAIHVLSGHGEVWYGEGLTEHMTFGPGDLIYIPAGVPHLPANTSDTEPCSAVLARTDPNEQESVVLRPDLDDRVPPEGDTIRHQ
ncbi:MAG: cupin domain-containing protein [Thermomicrobiales bacterium]